MVIIKILYVTDQISSFTGTIKFINNIVLNMKNVNRFQIEILSYSFDQKYGQSLFGVDYNETTYYGIKATCIRVVNKKDDGIGVVNAAFYDFFKNFLEDKKPDVIHICHPRYMSEIAVAAKNMRIPYIITLTDCFLFCSRMFLIDSDGNVCNGALGGEKCCQSCRDIAVDFKERILRASDILENAARIITPSIFLKNMYQSEFPKLKIDVVNHGLDITKFKPDSKTYTKESSIVLGFTSGISYTKGAFVLVDAFNKLSNLNNVKLKLYGSGSEDIIKLLSGSSNIELCGSFSAKDFESVYKSFDILICPSLANESYSFVINEALALRIPVICSNIGAMPEFVKNGVNGFTFDAGDSEQLAKIIELVAKNPEILNFLKANLYKFTRTSENEVNYYLKLYDNLMRECTGQCEKEEKRPVNTFDAVNQMFKNKFNYIIEDALWDECISKVRKSGIIIKPDFSQLMKIRLSYLMWKFNNEEVEYIIWGASNSGVVTKMLIDLMLPNFKLAAFVDKFKEGTQDGVKVHKCDEIGKLNFKYAFICTTPGREEAKKEFIKIDKNLIEDFMYGYGL